MTDPIDDGAIVPDGADVAADAQDHLADLDGDGIPDTITSDIDLDGDGTPDVHGAAVDVDGDGTPDILVQADAAQDIWGDVDGTAPGDVPDDVYAAMASVCDELVFPGYADLMATSGSPDADMALWDQQDAPMSCAVATTNMMFRSMGLEPGEDWLAEAFQNSDVYDPMRGSDINFIDDAINSIAAANGLDIQAETLTGVDVDDLETMLERGIRPLIAVDGAELYAGADERALNDLGFLPNSPHAVQLIGIEHTPEGNFAIINDPYPANGAGLRIPLDTFKDAWADGNNSCVAMSDGATMASLDTHSSGDGSDFQLGGMREPVTVDFMGNQYRGNCPIPFAGPAAPKTL